MCAQNFHFKKGSSKKITYERRTYESVDDRSLSYCISQKSTENDTQALMSYSVCAYFSATVFMIYNNKIFSAETIEIAV